MRRRAGRPWAALRQGAENSGTGQDDVGLVRNEGAIDEKNDIQKISDLQPAENNKILMNQDNDDAGGGPQIFGDHGQRRPPIDEDEHQRIELISPETENPQGEIRVEDAQEEDRADNGEIFGFISIDVIIYLFPLTPGYHPAALERMTAERLRWKTSSVGDGTLLGGHEVKKPS